MYRVETLSAHLFQLNQEESQLTVLHDFFLGRLIAYIFVYLCVNLIFWVIHDMTSEYAYEARHNSLNTFYGRNASLIVRVAISFPFRKDSSTRISLILFILRDASS